MDCIICGAASCQCGGPSTSKPVEIPAEARINMAGDLVRVQDGDNLFNFNRKDAADYLVAHPGSREVPRPVAKEGGSAASEAAARAIASEQRREQIIEEAGIGQAAVIEAITALGAAIAALGSRIEAIEEASAEGGEGEERDIEDLTRKELEALAAEKGVDIAGAKNKAEIIERIQTGAQS